MAATSGEGASHDDQEGPDQRLASTVDEKKEPIESLNDIYRFSDPIRKEIRYLLAD